MERKEEEVEMKKILNIKNDYLQLLSKRIIIISIILLLFVPTTIAVVTAYSGSRVGQKQEGIVANNLAASNSIFGVEETRIYVNDQLESGLDQMINSTTKWVRGPEVVWSDIEAQKGIQDWTKMESALEELDLIINLGYTPIVIVRGTPTWAQITGGTSCGPIQTQYFDEFADFIVAAKNEIESQLDYEIQFWEIWNEPDIDGEYLPADAWWGGCWGDYDDPFFGGKLYSKMLTVVYSKMKNDNPATQVLVGGLNLYCNPYNPPAGGTPEDCLPGKFFEGILDDAVGTNFDGVSFHAYDYYGGSYGKYGSDRWWSAWNTSGPSTIAKAAYLRQLLFAYGVPGKYLLNTENALLCWECSEEPGDDPEMEATKANYLAESYASAIANGLVANIWFDILGTWIKDNGLVDYTNLEPLPALDAYNFSSELLGGASLVSVISNYAIDENTSMPVGVFGYEFKLANPSYHVWMVRSIDGTTQKFTFPVRPVDVYDVYGEDLYPSGNPPYSLNLTVEPVYVIMPASVPRVTFPLVMNNFKNLGNNGFERGTEHWEFANLGLPSSVIDETPNNPITGTPDTYIPVEEKAAQLGDFSYSCNNGVPIGYASIGQGFSVPNEDDSVYLEFKYIVYSEDKNVNSTLNPTVYDRFEVYILSPFGEDRVFVDMNQSDPLGCGTWHRVPGTDNPRLGKTTGWGTAKILLNDYRGMNVMVSFQNHNRLDNWYNTITFVDDIYLTVEP